MEEVVSPEYVPPQLLVRETWGNNFYAFKVFDNFLKVT